MPNFPHLWGKIHFPELCKNFFFLFESINWAPTTIKIRHLVRKITAICHRRVIKKIKKKRKKGIKYPIIFESLFADSDICMKYDHGEFPKTFPTGHQGKRFLGQTIRFDGNFQILEHLCTEGTSHRKMFEKPQKWYSI